MNSLSVTVLVCVSLGYAQTRIDLRSQAQNPDFSTMSHTRPVQVGGTLPGSCSNGELFVNSNGPMLYICNSANTWSPVSSAALGSCTIDTDSNLSCPGSFFSGTGSVPGMLSLYELGTNGNNAISLAAPNSLAASYTLQLPTIAPQAGQVLNFGAPVNGISTGLWTPMSAGISPSIITTDVTSLPCTSANAGQLFLIPTGAGISGQCDGTTMRWLYNGFAVVPPGPKAGWTAKQADTSVANPDGSMYLSATNTSAYNGLIQSVSGSTTSFTVAYTFQGDSYNYMWCGIVAGDAFINGYGQLYGFGDQTNNTNTSPMTDTRQILLDFTGSPSGITAVQKFSQAANGLKWKRISIDGTHLHFWTSTDGLNWNELTLSTPYADSSPTLTQVGFACTTSGITPGTASMTVFSAVAR